MLIISDPVVVVVVMNMIDPTVTASDVKSSANVEWKFQRLFPSIHELAANACADCLSCHHKLPSFPFLAFHSAVFIATIVKPKRSQMLWPYW